MRDLDRIDPILRELAELWKLHPDWRLCQLLNNVAMLTGWNTYDLFHFEDGALIKGMRMLKIDLTSQV